MKQLNLLKTLFLLCALMVGSTSVWAADETYSLTPNQSSTGSSATTYVTTLTEFTYDGVRWKMNQWNPNSLQIKTNQGLATAEFRFYNTSAFSGRIKQVVITFSALSVLDEEKLMFLGGTEEVTATTGGTAGTWNSTSKTLTWTPDASDNFTFFAFYQNGKAANGTNYLAEEDAIVVTYEASTAETTTVTIDDSGITNKNLYKGTDAGSFSAVVKDASDATIGGAAVTWSSSETSVATIDENTGAVTLVAAGTTTITASYAGVADVYKSSSNTYELTVINDNPNLVTLWSEDFETYSKDAVPDGGTYDYTCVDGGSATKVYDQNYAGGTAPELLVGKNTGSFQAVVPLTNVIGDVILKYRTNAKSLTVSTSTTGVSISGDATFDTLGEHTVTFTGVTPSITSLTITFTPASDNVRLDDIVLKGSKVAPVTITTAEYATYVNETDALDFSETGITVYTATAGASAVTLNEVTSGQIPANTPVVLYKAGADGTAINVPVIASADAVGSNDLVKSIGSEPTNAYVLANKSYGVGFYKWAGGSLTSGKVYLQGTSSARDFLGFGDATGISEIETMRNGENEKFFNLAGQRVAQPTKGLYIVNGKKVIIK